MTTKQEKRTIDLYINKFRYLYMKSKRRIVQTKKTANIEKFLKKWNKLERKMKNKQRNWEITEKTRNIMKNYDKLK